MTRTNRGLIHKDNLEALYRKYNRREFVCPDPLQFLYHYKDSCDREIVALVASSLAYGRVSQIIGSVSSVLDKMGTSPLHFVKEKTPRAINSVFSGFKHRFTTDHQLPRLRYRGR